MNALKILYTTIFALFVVSLHAQISETISDKNYCNWEMFWQRSKHTEVDFKAYFNWLKQVSTNEIKTGSKVWQSLGPLYDDFEENANEYRKHVGQVTSIWVDPNNYDIIYIGTNNSGLWKTENAGENWRLLTPKWRFGVKDITVKPDNHDVMYITSSTSASAYLFNGRNGLGIFKTTDAGESWTKLQDIENEDLISMVRIIMNPMDYDMLYAVGHNKIYKSTQAGQNWKLVLDLKNSYQYFDGHLEDASINPQNPKQIALSGENMLFITDSGGNSQNDWENRLSLLLGSDAEAKTKIAVDYYDDVLYALYYIGSKTKIKKSFDNGLTWELVHASYLSANATVRFLEVFNEENIWAGGVGAKKSIDKALTFSSANGTSPFQLHADIRDIHFPDQLNPNLVYIATDGGICSSTDGGQNWKKIYGDLVITEVFKMDVSKQDPNYFIIGNGDNGTYRHTEKGWIWVLDGDGGECLINSKNDSISYAVLNASLYRSDNRFESVKSVRKKLVTYNAPIVEHPNEDNIIYIAEDKGYKLSKGVYAGNTWTWENWGNIGQGRVTAMDISKSNPSVFYFSRLNYNFKKWNWPNSFNLWKTTDDGKTWTELTKYITNFYPDVAVGNRLTAIDIHPTNPNMIWVTFGHFADGNRVFQTNNGGKTWINITHNLENLPVNTVRYDEVTDIVFIGNDFGVYYLNEASNPNSDQTWEYFADLPCVLATDLKINSNRELMLSTYGRGVWKADLSYFNLD